MNEVDDRAVLIRKTQGRFGRRVPAADDHDAAAREGLHFDDVVKNVGQLLARNTEAARCSDLVVVGGYATIPPQGTRLPQSVIYKSDNLKKRLPTNKWWSSLAWDRF